MMSAAVEPQTADARRPSPRVVMLLANTFEHDTRVFKEARSLIEWGCEVHVIALSSPKLPDEGVEHDIIIHRVPVPQRAGLSVIVIPMMLLWWCRPVVGLIVGRPRASAPQPRVAAVQADRRHVSRGLLARVWRRGIGSIRARFRRWVIGSWKRAASRTRQWRRRLALPSARLLGMNLGLARRALALEPDVIEAHDLNTLLAGTIVKRLSGAPLVYDSHELYLERNRGRTPRWLDRLVWWPVERFGIVRCDAVMSVAEGICRHLHQQYPIERPHLIRNVQPYAPPAGKSSVLAESLGVDPSRPLVIYAGAITINRGLEVMIDSAAFLGDDARAPACVIMGYARNAAYLQSLLDRARNRNVLGSGIFFHDAVPMHEVVRYVASADLSIVPTQNVCLSYYYEASNKIFHSLMAGVPLVMSDHLEKRLIVESWGVGVLFDETDPAAVARTVRDTLADRENYDMMARNCLMAARELNWEYEEHKFRTVVARLLGDRAPGPVPPPMIPALLPGDAPLDAAASVTTDARPGGRRINVP
jgi:glycosyltransferase involved in cell wall biosynthesis